MYRVFWWYTNWIGDVRRDVDHWFIGKHTLHLLSTPDVDEDKCGQILGECVRHSNGTYGPSAVSAQDVLEEMLDGGTLLSIIAISFGYERRRGGTPPGWCSTRPSEDAGWRVGHILTTVSLM